MARRLVVGCGALLSLAGILSSSFEVGRQASWGCSANQHFRRHKLAILHGWESGSSGCLERR